MASGMVRGITGIPRDTARPDFECCAVGGDGQLKAALNEQGMKAGKSSRDGQSFLLTGYTECSGKGQGGTKPLREFPEPAGPVFP